MSSSLFFVYSVRTEQTTSFDFVLVVYHRLAAVLNLRLKLLRHREKLVKVHSAFVSQVFLDLFIRMVQLSKSTDFIEIDQSILRFVGIEGFFDLKDLILVQSLIKIFLHLKISGECKGSICFRISH